MLCIVYTLAKDILLSREVSVCWTEMFYLRHSDPIIICSELYRSVNYIVSRRHCASCGAYIFPVVTEAL